MARNVPPEAMTAAPMATTATTASEPPPRFWRGAGVTATGMGACSNHVPGVGPALVLVRAVRSQSEVGPGAGE